MKQPYLILFCTWALLLTFWQAKALDHKKIYDSDKRTLGINNMKTYSSAPADSAFSIRFTPNTRSLINPPTLEVDLGAYKKWKYLRVYDLIGKRVFFQDLSFKSGVVTYKLNKSLLKPGIYFCRLYSEKGTVETKRFIHF